MGKRLLVAPFIAGLWLAVVLLAQPPIGVPPAHAPLTLLSPVQDKNFYLLSMLERTPDVKDAVAHSATLATIAKAKRESLEHATQSCDLDLSCYANAMKWTDAGIGAVKDALRELYRKNHSARQMVDEPLRASGMFVRYQKLAGDELLAASWQDAAHGINNAIEVYGTGRAPRYPEVDSVSFDVKSDSYRRLVQTVAAVLNDDRASLELFFQPSLRFALALMDSNNRDEAGRFEPRESGENSAAIERVKTILWDHYPYAIIVVPGSGTDRVSINLSPYGKLRIALAAKRYREGKASFILVSGGFVHPNQTPHSEAIEMKKSLIADFAIPANAILVDPHARHTTTNIRSAAREIYSYGLPFDKKALITTDPSQSRYIEDPDFEKRRLKELGCEPLQLLGRTSAFDLEFLPRIESLQADPLDPLDP